MSKHLITAHGTLLTNFDSDELSIYIQAIKLYLELIKPEDRYTLAVAEASNKYCNYGLYYIARPKSGVDMTLFWDIHSLIKENRTILLQYIKETYGSEES